MTQPAVWREVMFTVDREAVEAWSDALLEAGALSVQADDADADSPDEQALFGEPGMPAPTTLGWSRTRLAALLPVDADFVAVLRCAGDTIGAAAPLDYTTRSFDDQDWVRLSQSQFEPIPIGERLLITPSWHLPGADGSAPDAPASAGARADAAARISITLDPGLAFGTGSHPTTRMCLLWLERHLRAGERVIDYGCGSGILAIAAAKLGATPVVAIDIDPQALTASRANAQINQVQLLVQGTQAAAPAPANVVVANILATPLKLLAPLLQSLVAPGGALVLAGLLERQIDEVASLYTDMRLTAFEVQEGWACLAGRKSGS